MPGKKSSVKKIEPLSDSAEIIETYRRTHLEDQWPLFPSYVKLEPGVWNRIGPEPGPEKEETRPLEQQAR